MGEGGGDNNAGGTVERVTITEAAALLGCHLNTVRSRVKAGMYRAEKVYTENGPTWMIERDSLTTNFPTTARQQGVSGVPVVLQEALQELARAMHLEFLPKGSLERMPAKSLWPLTNKALSNGLFEQIEEVEEGLMQRCIELLDQTEVIRDHTNYHWWPQEEEAA